MKKQIQATTIYPKAMRKPWVTFEKKEKKLYENRLGVLFDDVFAIMNEDGEQIGLIFLSNLNDNSIYIEWLEIMGTFQAQGYLRVIFRELRNRYPGKVIQFESSDKNIRKYEAIGCLAQEKNDCTEMMQMIYPV